MQIFYNFCCDAFRLYPSSSLAGSVLGLLYSGSNTSVDVNIVSLPDMSFCRWMQFLWLIKFARDLPIR